MRMRRGFTLVELLIVLAIIGVLMSIGIPVYTNQLEKAKARVIAANLKTIAQSIANQAILGEDLNGFTTASLTQMIKGLKNPDAYKVYIASDTNTGTYDIFVAYNKTDVSTKLVQKEIGTLCDASSVTPQGTAVGTASPACVLKDIPNIGF